MPSKDIILAPTEAPPRDIWQRSEPRALINLLPVSVAARLIECHRARPDLFELDEQTLYRTLKTRPNATDNRLRLRFWDEYDRSQGYQKDMELHLVYGGVCSKQYFLDRYLDNPEKVAWLLMPPASYMVKMEEALAFGIERLRDILEQPLVGAGGKLDHKLAELQTKIVALLDIRLKGAPTQRIEQKNLNVSVSTSSEAVAQAALGGSMEALEKRLKELEKRDRQATRDALKAVESKVTDD